MLGRKCFGGSKSRGLSAGHVLGRASAYACEQLEQRCMLSGVPVWVSQGPGPINSPFLQRNIPGNSAAGAINSVAIDPSDGNRAFVATANGGIWRTSDLLDASPHWQALTDQMPSLSIGDIEFSPLDPTHNTLYAGVADLSSERNIGGPTTGIYETTDGGGSWAQVGLPGHQIKTIVPTANTDSRTGRQVILAGTTDGVWRTVPGISGWAQTLAGNITDLKEDPANPQQVYAAVANLGVFRSRDAGTSWTPILGALGSDNVKLAIYNSLGGNAVYVAIDVAKQLSKVYRSSDTGSAPGNSFGTWTILGTAPLVNIGKQGDSNLALVADPTDSNGVFVSGDYLGKGDVSGGAFRWDGVYKIWRPMDRFDPINNGPTNSAPHADSRSMTFGPNGDLFQTSDGGIYRLINPSGGAGPTRTWVSSNGDMTASEFFSVAYDPANKILFGGTQDNGTPGQESVFQAVPGNREWRDQGGGDGGRVAVDSSGTHYSYADDQLQRNGTPVSLSLPGGAPGSGLTSDDYKKFFTNGDSSHPIALDPEDQSHLLLGYNAVYESLDQGETLTRLSLPGMDGLVGDLAYGSSGGAAYVGTTTGKLFVRKAGANAFTQTAFSDPTAPAPGAKILKIVVDPSDWQTVYVLDAQADNQAWNVWRSSDAGSTWIKLTGNLATVDSGSATNTPNLQTLELYDPTPGAHRGDEVLLAGGMGGVYRLLSQAAAPYSWSKYGGLRGSELPNVLVMDLHYYADPDVLVAATFGRGVWTVSNASQSLATPSILTINGDMQFAGENDNIQLSPDPDNAGVLDIFVNRSLDQSVELATVKEIDINGLGGGNHLTFDGDFGNLTDNLGEMGSGVVDLGSVKVSYTNFNVVNYAGGDNDRLALTGGGYAQETITTDYSALGSGAMDFGGASVTYNNLQGVDDTATVANLTYQDSSSSTFVLGDGPTFRDGFTSITTTSVADAITIPLPGHPFVPLQGTVNFADKANVTLIVNNGPANVTSDMLHAPSGLKYLQFDMGSSTAGNPNRISIYSTPADVTTEVRVTQQADSVITVASFRAGVGVQDIKGELIVNDPVNTGRTSLTLDDSADTKPRSPQINAQTITQLAPAVIRYNYSDDEYDALAKKGIFTGTLDLSVTILGGNGTNDFSMQSLGTTVRHGPMITVNAGSDRDTFTVHAIAQAFDHVVTVNGGGGFNSLTVNTFSKNAPVRYSSYVDSSLVRVYYQNIQDFNLTSDAALPDGFIDLSPPSFNSHGSVPSGGHKPVGAASGDFNRDGIPDLASDDAMTGTVGVLLGNGDGSFRTPMPAPAIPAPAPAPPNSVGSGPAMMITADFNNDDITDLAVVDETSNDVSILVGNGDGTFKPSRQWAVGAQPIGLAAADLNGDGATDLAVTNAMDNTVSILLGNGDGTFRITAPMPVAAFPAFLAIADFNLDGAPDLAVANSGDHTLSLLLGNGDGTFRPSPQLPLQIGANPTGIVSADFNGDGTPDLAVTDFINNTVAILLNAGDGTFYQSDTAGTLATGAQPTTIATADFNGDGAADLVVTNSLDKTISVFLGQGDGTFLPETGSPFSLGVDARFVAIADFNRDGTPDLALPGTDPAGDGSVNILTNTADAPFELHGGLSVTASATQPASNLAVAEMDDPDFTATSSDYTATIDWGDGQLSPGTAVLVSPGQFKIVGDHTYALPGPYTISVTVTDNDITSAKTASVSSTASVAVAPAIYMVTNTNDSGPGSLAAAIISANASANSIIRFAIPASDPNHFYYRDDNTASHLSTLALTSASDDSAIADIDPDWKHSWWRIAGSALPRISNSVTIDGYSQAGSSPNTLLQGDNAIIRIELYGHGLSDRGLFIQASGSTVRGLAINNFEGTGQIDIGEGDGSFHGNTIAGNFIGTDVSGTVAEANAAHGNVAPGIVTGNVSGNTIGGISPADRNLISGNGGSGIALGGQSSSNLIEGNYIGVARSGEASLPNGNAGIDLGGGYNGSLNNIIGGSSPAARNLISGNKSSGISLSGNILGTLIQGNYIGTDAAGLLALPNLGDGIGVSAANRGSSLTSGIIIGGTGSGAGNLISGNAGNGISIGQGDGLDLIQGNFIGTSASAASALPNGVNGVNIVGEHGPETIGGSAPGAGNVISGNLQSGVHLSSSSPVTVQGNWIGTDPGGAIALGNHRDGVYIESANNNLIGGSNRGEGNTIAWNGSTAAASGIGLPLGNGVHVFADGTGNAILGNSIHDNVILGIDLNTGSTGSDGVTPNDPTDSDSGPNLLQNYPVLVSAATSAAYTTISGTLPGSSASIFRIEFFASATADPSGHGEAQTYLGFATATGNVPFTAKLFAPLPANQHIITATATDSANNTSEFSADVTAMVLNEDTTSLTLTPASQVAGNAVTFTATATALSSALIPTGAVDFLVDGTVLASVNLVGGQAIYTTSNLDPGDHTIIASYRGDTAFAASASPSASQTIVALIPTSTTLDASSATVFAGQTVTLIATVQPQGAGDPTGTVTFYDQGVLLGSATVSPVDSDEGGESEQQNFQAALSISTLNIGLHKLTAVYNGDGTFRGSNNLIDTIGVYDSTTSTWHFLGDDGGDDGNFVFGTPGQIPLRGDWSGSGHSGIGLFDPATATFSLRNDASAGAPDAVFQFGAPGWLPVVGDWDGNGTTTIGVVDPLTGTWYLRNSNTPGAPDAAAPFAFGAPGWLPVAGDWDGNGTTTIGAFDPGTGTWYLRNSNSPGAPDAAGPFAFGAPGWLPVVGDWDGDGKTSIGAYDPNSALWFLRNQLNGGAADAGNYRYGGANLLPITGHAPLTVEVESNTADLTVSVRHEDPKTLKESSNTALTGVDYLYVITVTNNGPQDADDISLRGVIAPGETVTRIESGGVLDGGAPNILDNFRFRVLAGTSVTMAITAHADTPGTYVDTFTATSNTPLPDPAHNSASATEIVSPHVADLSLSVKHETVATRKDAPNTALVGQDYFYLITVTNNGPQPADDIQISGTIAAGETVADSGIEYGGGILDGHAPSILVKFPFAVAPGTFITLGIIAHADTPGIYIDTFSATSDEELPDPAHNIVSATEIVRTATALQLASSSNPASAGQLVSFTATVMPAAGAFDEGGTVQFFVDGADFGAPVSLSAGVATIRALAPAVGNHTVSASFSGDTAFADSTATLTGGLIVNPVPPRVLNASFNARTVNQSISVTFSTDVSRPLFFASLQLTNLTPGGAPPSAPFQFAWNSASDSATWTYTGGTLPIGDYQLKLTSALVSDSTGIPLDGNGDGTPGDDFVFAFANLTGDVNGDRIVDETDRTLVNSKLGQAGVRRQDGDANGDGMVNFADLVAVAQHYGQSNTHLFEGDFNGDSKVDFADLVAVAQNYGRDGRADLNGDNLINQSDLDIVNKNLGKSLPAMGSAATTAPVTSSEVQAPLVFAKVPIASMPAGTTTRAKPISARKTAITIGAPASSQKDRRIIPTSKPIPSVFSTEMIRSTRTTRRRREWVRALLD